MSDDHDYDSENDKTLRARLWNAIPELSPSDRSFAERILESDELTKNQRRGIYALLARAKGVECE